MIALDEVTLAAHAKEHNLLDVHEWKKLRKMSRRAKILQRMVNNSKCAQHCNVVVCKFGVRVP